ncbi:hypothetical protein, variant [Allomyces macrogynus ATCC 38327]|uniref:Gpi16 subunit, GPI transamidase component n=1 Tax=Allomyces macrogynus (strain ATCC 38327) TaxID=578462 RepID=A0A0L0TDH3_ALLM3|nr:hypothetical protein, variant [Allomyces macrogynus ATCC 38327]|eukprot:KNE72720.1 hypothetical protein, variant [Allomyces macrogynus ATCC 38327]
MNRSLALVALAVLYLVAIARTGHADATHAKSSSATDVFTEHLAVDTLPDGKVLFAFDFVTKRPWSSPGSRANENYDLFPRTLGQVLDRFGVEALDLTMTQGRWMHDAWGWPVDGYAAPPGFDVRAWLRTESRNATTLDKDWVGLTNALSGLFCGSLNFLDATNIATPALAYKDRQVSRVATVLRHGRLAREAVCTENLTPWGKLLPCSTKAGLAATLNGYRLFDADYHSIQTLVSISCTSKDGACTQQLTQRVVAVFNPLRQSNKPDWSFTSLMDRPWSRPACALAASSTLHVTLPDLPAGTFQLHPADYATVVISDKLVATFDLKRWSNTNDFRFEFPDPAPLLNSVFDHPPPTDFSVSRYLTDAGQERGILAADLINHRQVGDRTAQYTDVLPWFVREYLHTVTYTCYPLGHAAPVDGQVEGVWFQHGIDRQRPTVMEVQVTVPASHLCTLQVEYELANLQYAEFRPDAERGFEVGSGLVTLFLNGTRPARLPTAVDAKTSDVVRIHADIVQMQLPVPDFSMPYNVITFTCTVLAFYFGSRAREDYTEK